MGEESLGCIYGWIAFGLALALQLDPWLPCQSEVGTKLLMGR